jgi:type I restriction enzyme S subunit
MPMSIFSVPSSRSSDEDYKYACDDSEARMFVENLWERYKIHADKDFTKKIIERFHNHFWEMYLACTLKDSGNNLLPKIKRKGPDIGIMSEDLSCIWVEATAATPGYGNDRIPLPKLSGEMWFRVPEEQIVLRYTTAVDAKFKKYTQYRNENVISESEPYIIAVNGNKVPYGWDGEIPYIVQAVLPFGLPTCKFAWDTQEDTTTGYAYRPEINKVSGKEVPVVK